MATFTTDQLAGAMYGYIETMMIYSPDTDALAEVQRINSNEGFTIDISNDNKLRGDITRYEGVRVSEERVAAAYNRTIEWMTVK